MAEPQTGAIEQGQLFRDAEGNLVVFRDGEFVPTTEQAVQTGPVEAALVGAGSAASNIVRGAQKLVQPIAGELLGLDAAALEDAGLFDQAQMDLLRAEQPVATIAGEAAPFVAGGIATGGVSLPAVLGGEALIGGLEASGGGRDPLTGAAFGAAGGAAGLGLGKMAQRLAAGKAARKAGTQPATELADELAPRRATRAERQAGAFDEAPTRLTEAQAPKGGAAGAQRTTLHSRMVGLADDTGLTLTTGERVNSDTMRQIEAGFRSQPGGPPRGKEIVRENQEVVNNKWSRAMGAGDQEIKITPEVMGQARENASAEFVKSGQLADAAGGVDVSGVADTVAATRAGRGQSLVQDQQVADALAELDRFETDSLSGIDFMATRSDLNTQMRKAAANSEGLLTQTYQDVINAMDDAFLKSAGPEASALYKQAREHQRFILTLERGKGVNLDQGNVNPTTAGTSLRKTIKQEAGRGDPGDLSDAGIDAIETTRAANYFKDIVGDSGTATRLAVQELISNPAKLLQLGVQRGVGEVFDRAVSPAVNRIAGGVPAAGTQTGGLLSDIGGGAGVLPLDIGGPSVPGGPLDL